GSPEVAERKCVERLDWKPQGIGKERLVGAIESS
ncbi:hypothetical protein NPIL_226621, partial [Nephila pilipes]